MTVQRVDKCNRGILWRSCMCVHLGEDKSTATDQDDEPLIQRVSDHPSTPRGSLYLGGGGGGGSGGGGRDGGRRVIGCGSSLFRHVSNEETVDTYINIETNESSPIPRAVIHTR